MLNKKCMVLNSVDDSKKKALLSLESNGSTIKGCLRLYNFSIEPSGIISLGFYYKNNVVKAGLIREKNMVYTFNDQLKEIPNKFSCAVINFSGGEANPILYGNSEGYNDQSEVFQQVITQLSETKTMNEVENVLDDYGIDYDDEEKENIESVITKNMDFEENNICNENCNSCENCKYKKYYFSKISSEDNIEDETNNKLDKNSHLKFYQEMKDQISKLFEGNPSEEYLQELVPNSKWVKVSLGEEKEYYVLGLMYDNDEIKYICYGVPGFYQKNPPRELSGYPIWFPLEQDKPEGFGYWLSYQDANSGESVKAIIV